MVQGLTMAMVQGLITVMVQGLTVAMVQDLTAMAQVLVMISSIHTTGIAAQQGIKQKGRAILVDGTAFLFSSQHEQNPLSIIQRANGKVNPIDTFAILQDKFIKIRMMQFRHIQIGNL